MELLPGERIDNTGFSDYVVIQGDGFSYGVDSVLLAAFATGKTGAKPLPSHARVLDLGTGNGVIPFILAHMNPYITITGVELQERSYDRAVRALAINSGHAARVAVATCSNAEPNSASPINLNPEPNSTPATNPDTEPKLEPALNAANSAPATNLATEPELEPALIAANSAPAINLADRVTFVNADIKDYAETCASGTYDAIVTNPPYFKRGAAIPSNASAKMIARHETTATLDDFIGASEMLLRRGGSFYMVHRPDRLAAIICSMRAHNIEPKELQLVAPFSGEPANILLVHGIKGAGEELRMLPEIQVHEGEGYSRIIEEIYER